MALTEERSRSRRPPRPRPPPPEANRDWSPMWLLILVGAVAAVMVAVLAFRPDSEVDIPNHQQVIENGSPTAVDHAATTGGTVTGAHQQVIENGSPTAVDHAATTGPDGDRRTPAGDRERQPHRGRSRRLVRRKPIRRSRRRRRPPLGGGVAGAFASGDRSAVGAGPPTVRLLLGPVRGPWWSPRRPPWSSGRRGAGVLEGLLRRRRWWPDRPRRSAPPRGRSGTPGGPP